MTRDENGWWPASNRSASFANCTSLSTIFPIIIGTIRSFFPQRFKEYVNDTEGHKGIRNNKFCLLVVKKVKTEKSKTLTIFS